MSKPNSQTNQKMTNDKFWQFRNLAGDDQKAELLLYGDISERSWWEDAATPKRENRTSCASHRGSVPGSGAACPCWLRCCPR